MSEKSDPQFQTCADCGTQIDVSSEEPFVTLHCPECGEKFRVRHSFDHFELQETLGSGGMGTVYRALDANLNRMVALKLLQMEYSADPEFVSQFKTEAAITASINHPHVVKVFSSGEDHGLLYIAMELVDQGSLDDLMQVEGQVSEIRVLEMGIQIAHGLNAAFQRGLIHRDIKPGNILFARNGTAKIVDFGLASLMDEARNVDGEIWGTPYYVAPEKLDNQPEDARSDIYSLGATLYHAIAGQPPFKGETASVSALRKLKSHPVSLEAVMPEVSSATAFVINKALQQDPAQRHQNYEELLKGLEYARTELAAKLRAEALEAAKTGAAGNSRMGEWITWVVMAGLVTAGIYFFNWNQNRSRESLAKSSDVRGKPARASVESRFKAARELIASQKHAEAAEALRKLDQETNVPQPLRNWISMHHGLALLLDEKEVESRAVFERLAAQGPFSSDESELQLATFFVETSSLLMLETPAPVTITKDFNNHSYTSFALLLAGLKNWNLENFEDAATILQHFLPAPEGMPELWLGDEKAIADLTRLAQARVADYKEFRNVADAILTNASPAKKKEVLELAIAGRSRLKLPGKLMNFLESAIGELEKEAAAHEGEMNRMAAEREGADMKTLAEANQKQALYASQLRFAEAHAAILAPKLIAPRARREQEIMVSKSECLVRFKSLLIRDINLTGYPQPIVRRTGQPVPGVATKADELQIRIRTQYGFLPIPWADVSLESVHGMALGFIRPGIAPDLEADRKWLLGAFASFAGKSSVCRSLMIEAAKLKPSYNESLPLFLEFAEEGEKGEGGSDQ